MTLLDGLWGGYFVEVCTFLSFCLFYYYFSLSLGQTCEWMCHVATKTDGVRWSDRCTLLRYLFMTISWSLLDRYDLFKWWLWLKVSLHLSTFIFQYHSPFIFSGSDLYCLCSPQPDCPVLISQQRTSVVWRRQIIPTQKRFKKINPVMVIHYKSGKYRMIPHS